MAHPFFKLRGKLPSKTKILIELIGLICILAIWQFVASIGKSDTKSFADELFVYHGKELLEGKVEPTLLIYDKKPIEVEELIPLAEDLANEKKTFLLVTSEPNSRAVQTLQTQVKDLNLIALSSKGNKEQLFQKLSDFSGASIITNDFFEEGEAIEIGSNFTGSVDEFSLGKEGLEFKINSDFISSSLLPSPLEVLKSYQPLISKDGLAENTLYSIFLNLSGYFIAILVAIPLGFIIGLFPLFRALFSRNVDALRFVPLTAVTGLFIAWFGIDSQMKIFFLAFGIIVYLLPVVVQRIDEVEKVYLQTAFTLGATQWQQIRTVFLPAVLSRVSDDARVLVAISWTYIIVAELVNANSGGIGALAYKSARMSQIDKVFAILLVIILIGFIQDKLFVLVDRFLFPHKHQRA